MFYTRIFSIEYFLSSKLYYLFINVPGKIYRYYIIHFSMKDPQGSVHYFFCSLWTGTATNCKSSCKFSGFFMKNRKNPKPAHGDTVQIQPVDIDIVHLYQ